MYDVLIKNGTVIDGSGKPMFRSDIGIKEDRIAFIGDLSREAAPTVIDATDRYVAPGFIDVNNHSDVYWQLLSDSELQSMFRQGVTTIIGGNAGSSLAPLVSHDTIRSIQKWTDVEKISFNWLSMREFLGELEKRRMVPNFATLVGHGTLRRGVLHDVNRPVKTEDIDAMKHLLRQAMKEGAIGFSTGLRYTHAKSATASEIMDLTEIAASFGGTYSTYLRDEGNGLIESIEEAIRTAQETKVGLHISHLKASGRENWHLFEEALNCIEAAASGGLPISFDIYPYTTTGSVLYTFLPDWVTEGGRRVMLRQLRDVRVRNKVVEEMRRKGTDYSTMTVLSSSVSKLMPRRHIVDIAAMQKKSPEEAIVDVLLASDGRAIVSIEAISDHNMRHGIQHPFSIISSNGSGYSIDYAETGDRVHPRNFGSFPRVLGRYVREEKLLSWEEAIHKMTGQPAQVFHIENRGRLKEDYFADIVVFDPEKVIDIATMENPYQYPIGIQDVVINGTVTLASGRFSGVRPGRVLYRKKSFFSW
jgi:N-acyl-D-amino-acid deacylase